MGLNMLGGVGSRADLLVVVGTGADLLVVVGTRADLLVVVGTGAGLLVELAIVARNSLWISSLCLVAKFES